MQKKNYVFINFDLNGELLRENYNKSVTYAYKEIEKFFSEKNFIHRQQSGYLSTQKYTSSSIVLLANELNVKLPWLTETANRIDISLVSKEFDILNLMKKEKVVLNYAAKYQQYEEKSQMSLSEWENEIDNITLSEPEQADDRELDDRDQTDFER